MQKTFILAIMAVAAGSAFAQAAAPYAGQQAREIKSMPAAEVADLLAGQGMGLAKAAELNGYPGPAHVLENAEALVLTAQQKEASKTLMDEHKERARQIGAALVASERALDEAFARRHINEAGLGRLTAEIGRLQARLREEHLRTHLAQTALLGKGQIERYQQLRGYSTAAGDMPAAPAQHRKHH